MQQPPVFTIRPKPIYITKLGETVVMSCDASDRGGQHRAVTQWRKKDGTPLPFSRVTFEGTNITIEKINETDRGIYQCTATNEAATIAADTEITIENVAPRPPYNLSANSTDTTIMLHWEPGNFTRHIVPNSKHNSILHNSAQDIFDHIWNTLYGTDFPMLPSGEPCVF